KLNGHPIMGIQTIGKHMAIGASPTVQPHPTVTRCRFVALWFSAGIVVSVLTSWRFLNYRELPHLYQELQHLVPFDRQPDASNNSLLLQMASQATDLRVSWNRSATATARRGNCAWMPTGFATAACGILPAATEISSA